jgi:tripartite-type tricarboxylate transporter receptor subunit TctC
MPADRVAALRKAFMEMARSPAFQKEAETMRIDVDPVTGEDMQKVVHEIMRFPASVKERAAHFVE